MGCKKIVVWPLLAPKFVWPDAIVWRNMRGISIGFEDLGVTAHTLIALNPNKFMGSNRAIRISF